MEHLLAKEGVAGSIPVSRLKKERYQIGIVLFFEPCQGSKVRCLRSAPVRADRGPPDLVRRLALVKTRISVFMVHKIYAKRRRHFLAAAFLLIVCLLFDFIRIFDAVDPTQGIVHAVLGDGSVLDSLQYAVVCGLEVLRRIDHVAAGTQCQYCGFIGTVVIRDRCLVHGTGYDHTAEIQFISQNIRYHRTGQGAGSIVSRQGWCCHIADGDHFGITGINTALEYRKFIGSEIFRTSVRRSHAILRTLGRTANTGKMSDGCCYFLFLQSCLHVPEKACPLL